MECRDFERSTDCLIRIGHPIATDADDLRWLRHYHRFLGKFCNLEAETVVQGDFEVWREQQHQHVA